MLIRSERDTDKDLIWEFNAQACETQAEANLVNVLRGIGCKKISLVAEIGNKVVGYILFTPVELIGDENSLELFGLAPMGVLPEYQKQGIGSELVKEGLKRCQSIACDAVVVLGHPNYYPKFGFVPSVQFGIKSEYEVPNEAFMILELVAGVLQNHTGVIKYHEAFNQL